MLIEQFLPTFDFRERHAIDIAASPEAVFRALRSVTLAEVRLYRVLLALRMLPAGLLGLDLRRLPGDIPVLEHAVRAGFLELAAEPAREIVLGAAGQFWRPGGGLVPLPDAAAFAAFASPGCAKVALNFALAPAHRGTHLATETRVLSTDASARARFGVYWRVIAPASSIVRRTWLDAVKRRAEAGG